MSANKVQRKKGRVRTGAGVSSDLRSALYERRRTKVRWAAGVSAPTGYNLAAWLDMFYLRLRWWRLRLLVISLWPRPASGMERLLRGCLVLRKNWRLLMMMGLMILTLCG